MEVQFGGYQKIFCMSDLWSKIFAAKCLIVQGGASEYQTTISPLTNLLSVIHSRKIIPGYGLWPLQNPLFEARINLDQKNQV